MRKRKHSFDFDGAQFGNSLEDGPKIFKSIEDWKKAKEKGREKFWIYVLVGAFIFAMILVISRSPKPPPPSAEERARMEYVKKQLHQ